MITNKHLFLVVFILAAIPTIGRSDDSVLLRDAARRGDTATVKELLQKKVDIDGASEYGVTALALACDHGHSDVVAALLAAGASPNTRDKFYRFSPLGWAVMRKHTPIIELLLKHGTDDINSVFGNAVGMQQTDMVQLFLDSKKLSNQGVVDGLLAAKSMKADAIAKLIEATLTDESRALLEKSEQSRAAIAKLNQFAGLYLAQDGSKITVRVADEKLQIFEGEQEKPQVLEAAENDEFIARGTSALFQREADKVVSVRWKTGDREIAYLRTTGENADATVDKNSAEPSVALGPDFPLASAHWPNFRGLLSRGVNNDAPIATEWNGEAAKGIAWKTPIPGLGTSSPIVWGNRVFVTTAIQSTDTQGFRTGAYGDVESVNADGECSYQIMCVDLVTGKVLWDREAKKHVPKVKRHAKSSHANPTPTTDGERVIALFGEAGIYCYDMDGAILWNADLGTLDSGWFYDRSYQWGFGSSPMIFEDMVLVQCDVHDGSFLVALDLKTGKERWRTNREEIPTWSSPVAFLAKDGTPTVVVSGTKCTAAYNARSGSPLWKVGGFSEIVVPTPQITPDLAFITSGYAPVQPMVAILHNARGELHLPKDNEKQLPFLWSQMRGGPYMPTPIIADGNVYILDNSGLLTCLSLESGKRNFRQRLRNEKANAFTSSPVAANGNLYCTSEEGITFVVAMDDKGTIVSQNELGEAVLSSLAIAGGKLLVRAEKHLFAIESPAK